MGFGLAMTADSIAFHVFRELLDSGIDKKTCKRTGYQSHGCENKMKNGDG